MNEQQHEITVTIGLADQVYEVDWNGRIIKDANNIFAGMQCTLDIDNSHRVAFGIRSSFPKDQIKESEDKNIIKRLNFLTWVAIPNYLSHSRGINIFDTHQLSLIEYLGEHLPDASSESSEYLAPFKCMIGNEAYESLNAQYDKYLLACKSFDYAVEKLSHFAELDPHGVKYHHSKIFSLLSFIEQSLAAADVGHLYSWYREKQSGIRGSFNDMLRRKQGNHPGYISAQEYIRRSLRYDQKVCK